MKIHGKTVPKKITKDNLIIASHYYALVETKENRHIPVPLLPLSYQYQALKVLQDIYNTKDLKNIKIRGENWFFHCPICNAQVFYKGLCDICFEEDPLPPPGLYDELKWSKISRLLYKIRCKLDKLLYKIEPYELISDWNYYYERILNMYYNKVITMEVKL